MVFEPEAVRLGVFWRVIALVHLSWGGWILGRDALRIAILTCFRPETMDDRVLRVVHAIAETALQGKYATKGHACTAIHIST